MEAKLLLALHMYILFICTLKNDMVYCRALCLEKSEKVHAHLHSYPMSVQSVKKRNGCTLATAHKKISAHFGRGGKKRKVPSLDRAE